MHYVDPDRQRAAILSHGNHPTNIIWDHLYMVGEQIDVLAKENEVKFSLLKEKERCSKLGLISFEV